MWNLYDLDLHVDRLVGGIPKHPEIVKRWQEAKWPTNPARSLQPGDPATPDEAADATVALLGAQAFDADEKVAGIWTGFAMAADELAIEARNVKAMLKESANICKPLLPTSKTDKTQAWKSKVAERVFVEPLLIPLGRTEAETSEKPIHVMTAQGPRTALKRTDFLTDVHVVCVLKVLNDGLVTEEVLSVLLEHASVNGIGTDRSQGNGTFTFKLARREPS